jgi:hypothetical protein
VIKEEGIPKPTAALIKALLINSAKKLSGQYVPSEVGPVPNNSEGFGRVDVASIVAQAGNGQLLLKDEKTKLDTGEDETTTVVIPMGVTKLKATLVWTDPGGAGLQNDLDLIVRVADGTERHGNQAPGSTAFDRTNNVEQVSWDNLSPGNVSIRVTAFRAAQFPQPYALVVSLS